MTCPYCRKLVGWYTAGGHHKDKPLGLSTHICPNAANPWRKVYRCSHCGRIRSIRFTEARP